MKRRLLFVILGSLIAVSGFTQSDLQPAATINLIRTEALTVRQLRAEVERRQVVSRQQILDLMINERLVLQAAERDRIIVTENEVNQQIQQLRNNMAQQIGRQPTDAEFAEAVRNESGLDVNAFREETRKQMIAQKYLMTKKADLINTIRRPTDEEIQMEYYILRSQLVRPETVRFSMIQIPYGPDATSKARARGLAETLLREIGSNPSKFDEVAARSVAPNSGYVAGDASYLPRNSEARDALGQNFMNIAFSLNQGQVSGLIEGVPGYQIIKITENHAQRNLELYDIIQHGTNVTVRDYVGQKLLSERQQAIYKQASEEIVTELRAGRSFQIFENNLNW